MAQDEYNSRAVDNYIFDQLKELQVTIEVMKTVQNALREAIFRSKPELIDEAKETILGVAELTEPLWRDEADRQKYRDQITQEVKMLDFYRK